MTTPPTAEQLREIHFNKTLELSVKTRDIIEIQNEILHLHNELCDIERQVKAMEKRFRLITPEEIRQDTQD